MGLAGSRSLGSPPGPSGFESRQLHTERLTVPFAERYPLVTRVANQVPHLRKKSKTPLHGEFLFVPNYGLGRHEPAKGRSAQASHADKRDE